MLWWEIGDKNRSNLARGLYFQRIAFISKATLWTQKPQALEG